MFDAVTHFSVWVTDQDQALDFYVGKLGFEVHSDLQLDFMRWLTITLPGGHGQQIILTPLAPPIIDPGNAKRARDLLSKGFMTTLILSSPDCRASYEKLRGAGVEFTQEPLEQPYGIECVARDPFGNQIRIAQPTRPATP